jgi:hypothetical protein
MVDLEKKKEEEEEVGIPLIPSRLQRKGLMGSWVEEDAGYGKKMYPIGILTSYRHWREDVHEISNQARPAPGSPIFLNVMVLQHEL